MELKYLDPVGNVVSKWIFGNSQIGEVKFSDPNYDNNELMTCELIVTFDQLEIVF